LKLDSDDINTLGGWVSSQVEIPPHPGQKISHEEYELVVEEADNMRVTRVLMQKIASKNHGAHRGGIIDT